MTPCAHPTSALNAVNRRGVVTVECVDCGVVIVRADTRKE